MHDHHDHQNHDDHDKHAGHSPAMFKQKFWLSLLLAIPTLVFSQTVQSWLHYSWTFSDSRYIPAIFGVILFRYGGLVFIKSARTEIKDKQPGMMTLISMAITVAFGYSLAVTLKLANGMDFWWELSTLIVIMLLGHWLEMASVQNAQGALKELAKLLPDQAELIDKNGETQTVAAASLKVGDTFLVRPGGRVPADGTVVKGESSANESMLTGESKPVKKQTKSMVVAGSVNGSGSLTVKVVKVGDDTALAGIMKLVADAQKSKSKTQILADKAAFYLTFIALGTALITLVIWLIAGESGSFVLQRVVTVLVVACPHALGLAIPLVVAISTTMAARNGLLIRQRSALEMVRKIDVVLFDKTGTLTKGEQGVVDVVTTDKKQIITVAAAAEAESEHPIARAIVAYATQQKYQLPKTTKFVALAGRGVQATVGGKTVLVGGPQLLQSHQTTLSQDMQQAVKKAGEHGQTVVYVVQDNQVLGAIMLADVIRPESRQAVQNLQNMGAKVAMVTGDSQAVASWVAAELGIDQYFAEVLPERKADIVTKLQNEQNKVAMVGDGVNDAPALTQADVGIAIGAGTDVAIESAGIVLVSSDPRAIVRVMRLSRATYRKMQQNLAWATGYNAVALPLAAGAAAPWGFWLSPAAGAVLMSLSTIIVAANAQLLRRAKL